jgi:hypothetical protein
MEVGLVKEGETGGATWDEQAGELLGGNNVDTLMGASHHHWYRPKVDSVLLYADLRRLPGHPAKCRLMSQASARKEMNLIRIGLRLSS